MRRQTARVIILGVSARRAQIDTVDRRDAIALDNSRRLSGPLRRHGIDEHSESVATRPRRTNLDAERGTLRQRRIHVEERPFAPHRISLRSPMYATLDAAARISRTR